MVRLRVGFDEQSLTGSIAVFAGHGRLLMYACLILCSAMTFSVWSTSGALDYRHAWEASATENTAGNLFEPRWPFEVGHEFMVDTSIIAVSKTYTQQSPAMAFDGENYLVVWADIHSWAPIHICGILVDTAGNPLTVAPVSICDEPYWQLSPAVAFNGETYLVVWEHYGTGCSRDIHGARVSTSGIVLDTVSITICAEPETEYTPAVASDGETFLVVWEDRRSDSASDIYGARVDGSGAVLDTLGFAISAGDSWQESPSITYDGSNYFVVWMDFRNRNWDVYGTRVSPTGQVLDAEGISISVEAKDQTDPSVAPGAGLFLVAWSDRQSPSPSEVYAARVTSAGVVLDTSAIFVTSDPGRIGWSPAVDFDGQNFFVAWTGGDVFGARITPGGSILDIWGIGICWGAWTQTEVAIAHDSKNWFLVWEDDRSYSSTRAYGARVTNEGEVLDLFGFPILDLGPGKTANWPHLPVAAFDGENYLVVWADYFLEDVRGVRVSPAGVQVDPVSMPICTTSEHLQLADVACGDGNYLVVWQDLGNEDDDIFGTRVSPTGEVLDIPGIAIAADSGDQNWPSVAFDGANYFVVWRDGPQHEICGRRISPAGELVDTVAVTVSYTPRNLMPTTPSLAFNGTNYLVVWSGLADWHIGAALVEPNGHIIESGIRICSEIPEGSPALSSDGLGWLVVWSDHRFGTDYDVFGARLDENGVVLDTNGFVVCGEPGSQNNPSVSYDGKDYLIAWCGPRPNGCETDIYGASVTSEGTVLEEFPISTSLYNQSGPAIARGLGDQSLVVWGRPVDAPYHSERAWGALFSRTFVEEESRRSYRQQKIEILDCRPNPFSFSTEIRFSSPAERASLSIYDTSGRVVRTLFEAELTRGTHRITWNGRSSSGAEMPGGVYFCRLEGKSYSQTKKIVLLRLPCRY